MADLRITQKVGATLTYVLDCSNRLTKAYPAAPVTISSAVGVISSGSISAVSGSGTSVTFKVAIPAVPVSTDVLATLTPTLSNGDVDPIEVTIGAVA